MLHATSLDGRDFVVGLWALVKCKICSSPSFELCELSTLNRRAHSMPCFSGIIRNAAPSSRTFLSTHPAKSTRAALLCAHSPHAVTQEQVVHTSERVNAYRTQSRIQPKEAAAWRDLDFDALHASVCTGRLHSVRQLAQLDECLTTFLHCRPLAFGLGSMSTHSDPICRCCCMLNERAHICLCSCLRVPSADFRFLCHI